VSVKSSFTALNNSVIGFMPPFISIDPIHF
jgi:hypothetical protein